MARHPPSAPSRHCEPATDLCPSRVVVVTPRYLTGGKGDAELQALEDTGMRKTLEVKPGDKQTVSFFHCRKNGVSYVFIDHPAFHRKGGLYGANGRDYDDNHWRFALFRRAAPKCHGCLQPPISLPASPA